MTPFQWLAVVGFVAVVALSAAPAGWIARQWDRLMAWLNEPDEVTVFVTSPHTHCPLCDASKVAGAKEIE